jgi:hypothetical protein
VQLKSSARECIDKRLREIAFVLIHREGAVRHRAVQGVRRLRKEVSVVKLSRSFRGLLLQDNVESKEARTVEVFTSFPQGVREKNLVEVEVT